MVVSVGNWIDLSLDRDYWSAIVSAALNLGFTSHGVSFAKLLTRVLPFTLFPMNIYFKYLLYFISPVIPNACPYHLICVC